MREYDLNIWYPDGDPEAHPDAYLPYGTAVMVMAYVYEDGEYKGEGPMIQMTPEETEILRIQMPEWEYQDDWWYGLEGFLRDIAIPPRLEHFLRALPTL
jgi:hypothetical protein